MLRHNHVTLSLLFAIMICRGPAALGDDSAALREPWDTGYTGSTATGPHLIGLWNFDGDDPLADASGNGHALTLEDAEIVEGGRFGKCLETFPGWPVEDSRHRAMVDDAPELSPAGPFTLEMWIKPKAELDADSPGSFLLDKKYVAPTDYQLILGTADASGRRVLRAILGFGADSSTFFSEPAAFEPGRWVHVAFTYDGLGTGSFFLDGRPAGKTFIKGRAGIAAGKHRLYIGDRVGSRYGGFPGFIDQVRISNGVLEFRDVKLELVSDRRAFVRMEPNVKLEFRVTNLSPGPLERGSIAFSLDGRTQNTAQLGDLPSGQSATIEFPLDTALRGDAYQLVARLNVEAPKPIQSRQQFPLHIVPRRPEQFPVLMWGIAGRADDAFDRLERIGFSHVLGLSADTQRVFTAGEPTLPDKPENVERNKRMLDEALTRGITISATLSPGSRMRDNPEFQRIDRNGERRKTRPDICGLFPEMQTLSYNVGASVVRTYGHYPAFGAALLHTEVRDHAYPCFHEHDRLAFREAAGLEIPALVAGPRGVDYSRLPDFPASRVIPDDHPLYVYYRWYWKQGDGWNDMNRALRRGLRSTGRTDLWTFHDPAVRVASVYGSGADVDYLSQWTYSYPDPIRIGLATDELLAMAAPNKAQRVMKMTQIIWYRSQTAPPRDDGDSGYRATWEREQPDAPFITIPPMHLREAFWTKIARPIRGIMYHGWQSLVPCPGNAGYRFTHPQTQHELARLIRQVIRPLGPTLLNVPGTPSDVAMLECFASEMFARRGTFGWGGSWAGDVHHVLSYAHLQPEIIFDETIVAGGLDRFKVLVMPDCDVITESMAQRIKAFQQRGGIVVGDERTAPAIQPDVLIDVYQRTAKGDVDKAALQALAAQLRTDLAPHFQRPVDTASPEVIPYLRRFGPTDYVFLVNDRREFGDYVGQHGIVMENGVPSEAMVTVARPDGFVYDLVHHRPVDAAARDGRLAIPVRLGPCDGRLLMICPQAIDRVEITGAATTQHGKNVPLEIAVVDAQGRAVEAVVPLEIEVRDAEGRRAEWSGYHAAVGGRLSLALDIATNDRSGVWEIEVRELASGRRRTHFLRVESTRPAPASEQKIPATLANPVQPRG